MVFGIWQPLYAAHGIAIFPVGIDERGKVPKTRGWQSIGLRGSAKLAQTMADADAFGFCLGKRSGLTILDIDSSDERILAEALDRHGPTPILVRSGSGNYQGWYRHNGETRRIRPDPNKPIDILGSGFVVAPPSKGMKSNYKFVQGGLDDLVTLPCLRNVLLSGVEVQVGRIGQGNRNNALFEHCMRQARHCDDFDALIDVAHTSNATFSPPLPDDEVVKIAKSAWDYTQRGENRFGRHGVFFSTEEVNQLIARGPDQFTLLAFLRANNGPESAFMVANGLAKEFGWGPKRLAATRRRLEGTEIKMVKRPSAKNGPARYRWLNKAGRK